MMFKKVIMVAGNMIHINSEKAGKYKAGDLLILNSPHNHWNGGLMVVGNSGGWIVGYALRSKSREIYWEEIGSYFYKELKKMNVSKKEKEKILKEVKEEIQNKLDEKVLNKV